MTNTNTNTNTSTDTAPCGCRVRAIDAPDDQFIGQGHEVVEPCPAHTRAPTTDCTRTFNITDDAATIARHLLICKGWHAIGSGRIRRPALYSERLDVEATIDGRTLPDSHEDVLSALRWLAHIDGRA